MSNISDSQYTSEHSNVDSPTVELPEIELMDRSNKTLLTLEDSDLNILTDQYPQIGDDAMYMEAPREVFPSMIKVRTLDNQLTLLTCLSLLPVSFVPDQLKT